MLDLKQRFNNQEKPDLSRYSDINVVPGVVKLFLRELPIPVITFDAYSEVMKATSKKGRKKRLNAERAERGRGEIEKGNMVKKYLCTVLMVAREGGDGMGK